MDIKEFISKVKIYNEGYRFEALVEALAYCVGCEECPFAVECDENRESIFTCEEVLKKHLTTD